MIYKGFSLRLVNMNYKLSKYSINNNINKNNVNTQNKKSVSKNTS